MLILTRYSGQALLIQAPDGQKIYIKAFDVCYSKVGSCVKLGIEAPDDYTILREEILSRVGEEGYTRKKKG